MFLKSLAFISLASCLLGHCSGQVTSEGCGSMKMCFQDPPKCNPMDATCHFISWMKSADGNYEFEMSGGMGNGQQYIAFALGIDDAMESADLYYCDGKQIRSGVIQKLHYPPAYLQMNSGLRTISATTMNGVGQCVLSRPASVTKDIGDMGNKDFDITKQKFFLLVAMGDMDGDQIMKHTWRNMTANMIDFSMHMTPLEITADDCGMTKNCFKDPPNCDVTDSGCRYFSWVKGEEGKYVFEMSGGTGAGMQYIAMALGLTDKMQDADLYYCDGKTVRTGAIQTLHTPPTYYEMTGGLATKSATTANGVAKCSFTRPASVMKTISNDTMHDFDITKEEYHLLGAIGPMNGSKVEKHNVWISATEYTINFASQIAPISTDSCGNTKQCFSSPPNCEIGTVDCHFFSWEKANDGTYNFEMVGGDGSENPYVAIALGTVDEMKDADLYYCDGHTVRSAVIRDRHDSPTYLARNKRISTNSATVDKGVVHCAFNRPASVSKEISKGITKNFDLARENYYLLAAVGKLAGTKLEKHSWATVTSQKMVPHTEKIFSPIFEEVEMAEF